MARVSSVFDLGAAHIVRDTPKVVALAPTGQRRVNKPNACSTPTVLAGVLQCLAVRDCTASEIASAIDAAYSSVCDAVHVLKTWGWVETRSARVFQPAATLGPGAQLLHL